jgi:hypothetical protein
MFKTQHNKISNCNKQNAEKLDGEEQSIVYELMQNAVKPDNDIEIKNKHALRGIFKNTVRTTTLSASNKRTNSFQNQQKP